MKYLLRTLIPMICLTLTLSAQVYEETTVYLRDIRVYVTGKDGKPLRGLNASDFIVEEGNQIQDPSFFQEVDFKPLEVLEAELDGQPVADEAVTEPQYNMMVLDSSNMSADSFERVRDLARTYIQSHMRPNELLRVVHVEKSMNQLCNFTSNKDKLLDAINRAQYQGYLYGYDLTIQRDMASESHGVFQSASQTSLDLAQYKHLAAFTKNMIILNQGLMNIKGSKSILLFTGGYDAVSGNLKLINKLAYRLNQTNTTLHGFVHDHRLTHVNLNIAERSQPINGGVGGALASLENAARTQKLSGPREHADRTGGIFRYALGTGKLEQKFDRFMEAQNHYYRIGYSILDAQTKSKVKIKLRKGLKGKLNYGSHFRNVNDKKLDELGEKYRDETTMLYSSGIRNDLDMEVGYGVYRRAELIWSVPVNASLPLRKFKKGLIVGFAALDSDRDVLDVIMTTVEKPGSKGRLTFHDLLVVEEPPAYVRFFIKDPKSGDLSIMETVCEDQNPDLMTAAPASLMVGHLSAGDIMPLNQQRVDVDAQHRNHLDPCYLTKNPFLSATDLAFPMGQRLIAMFQYRNELAQLTNASVRYAVEIDGQTFEQSGQLIVKSGFGGTDPIYRAVVTLGQLPTGDARLVVSVTDPATGAEARTGIDLTIVEAVTKSAGR